MKHQKLESDFGSVKKIPVRLQNQKTGEIVNGSKFIVKRRLGGKKNYYTHQGKLLDENWLEMANLLPFFWGLVVIVALIVILLAITFAPKHSLLSLVLSSAALFYSVLVLVLILFFIYFLARYNVNLNKKHPRKHFLSVGGKVHEYDPDKKTIKKFEITEVSLVDAPDKDQ